MIEECDLSRGDEQCPYVNYTHGCDETYNCVLKKGHEGPHRSYSGSELADEKWFDLTYGAKG